MDFSVTVILPVYNSEKYISEAILSAVTLDEVGEIIVIDDGSTDNSLTICRELACKYSKIRILQHNDLRNHGRSASRNLGIKAASCEYISFLDSDDMYLPNRFQAERVIFSTDSKIDGIYGATLAKFETETAKELFFKRYDSEITEIKKTVHPGNLLEVLLFGGIGNFTTDAVTVKKNLFEKTGYYLENIELGEDIHLWYRMAAKGKLIAGSLDKPIAIRRVHENNSIHRPQNELDKDHSFMYTNLLFWALQQKDFSYNKKNIFFIALHSFINQKKKNEFEYLLSLLRANFFLLKYSFFYRKLMQLIIRYIF